MSMISRREFLAASAAIPAMELTRWPLPAPKRAAGFAPWLEIDSAALTHNVREIGRLAGNRPIIAVVKNNAYGQGLDVAGPLLARMDEVRAQIGRASCR